MQKNMSAKNEKTTAKSGRTSCIRCGTCCEKGGPALHGKDLDRVLQKKISPENLFTIRSGELMHDNVNGGLIRTTGEIIKIRPARGKTDCIYYNPVQKACVIYKTRPIECRVMACWDTEAAEALYAVDRLNRTSVFGSVDWLMEIIRTHEEKCGYQRIGELAEKRLKRQARAGEAILEAVRYDAGIRRVVQKKAGLNAGMMELVFGRPLQETIPVQFGIKLVRNGR